MFEKLRRIVLAPCVAFAGVSAFAQELPHAEWSAVETALLDNMRGGFGIESGLKISFGIERSVSINGELASTLNFTAADIGKLISGQEASALPNNMIELIQNGPANVFQASALPSTATFVQNTLSDQTIRSMTVISTTTNSLEILKGMNLHSVLNDALLNAAALR
ncbi:MAG: hypothetical protein HYS18_11775 [Burkholderiales bacterium]|nr:hypothetical protein [Burkholderiales bacterium]